MMLREVVTNSKVGDLPLSTVPCLSPDQTVAAAVTAMRQAKVGSVVITEGDRLVGILTERDVLRLVDDGTPLSILLKGAMTQNVKSVQADDSLLTVLRLMDAGGHRRLPVVDATDKPLGTISTRSVVHFLVEHFPQGVYNQTSQVLQTARDREGA